MSLNPLYQSQQRKRVDPSLLLDYSPCIPPLALEDFQLLALS